MAVNWTNEQQQAIYTSGGSLLVSAAAGSGKTAVLSERVVQILTRKENPAGADTMLIVTFTRLAAAEMKQRISDKLAAMLENDPANKALRRQQLLLESAKISTIDSFCQSLIRENFQLLDLPYDFRVADEKELQIMRADAIRETIEKYYMEDSGEFSSLIELLSGSRSDQRAEETILRLYDFIRSHPFYENWLDEKLGLYDPGIPLDKSPWAFVVLGYAMDGVEHAISLTNQAICQIKQDEQLTKAYLDAYQSDHMQLCRLLEVLNQGEWDNITWEIDSFSFEKLGRLTKYEDLSKKAQITGLRDKVKEIIKELKEKRFCCSSEEFKGDIAALRPQIQLLFEVTLEFGRQLDKIKLAKKTVDFPDLTHYALRLLVSKDEKGNPVQTPLALQLSQRLSNVLVDEYQDTNEAQDMLFWAVSDRGKKLFVVGDVKQSIYRFRQAMPGIFLSKKESYLPVGSGFPAKIILGKNFRSRSAITGWVNFMFTLLMSKKLGEMDYGEEDRLTAGLEFQTDNQPGCSLHIIDTTDESSEDKDTSEARYTAALVKDILDSDYQIEDRGQMRSVKPSDIAILLRSPKGKSDAYVSELAAVGVPAWSESQTGFLSSLEVSSVIALLKILDNPLLDMEFVQVLLSPIFSFSTNDVAELRLSGAGQPFYLLVQQAAADGWGKCKDFLDKFKTLRNNAVLLPVHKLIKRIYDVTGFDDIVRAMDLGRVRLSNLRLLIQYAADYQAAGYRGLDSFLRLITRLEENGSDLNTAAARGGEAAAVMSIHASKGLEFPIVILSGCGRKFNTDDQRSNTMLSSEMGFACVRRNSSGLGYFTTLPLEAMRIENTGATLSEELRVLYVALTRARQRLYITAALKNPDRKIASLAVQLDGGRFSPWMVRSAACFADWIIMCALHHRDGGALRYIADMEYGDGVPEGSLEVVLAKPPLAAGRQEEKRQYLAPVDEVLLERIRQRLCFKYPHQKAVEIPSKFSVSQLIHAGQGESFSHAPRPAFMTESGMTGAEKGTALHAFLQLADLDAALNDPEGEKQRLKDRVLITPQQAVAIDNDKVTHFLNSHLGKRIFSAQKYYRELRFLCEAGEDILGDLVPQIKGDNRTMLQGVADLVIIEPDGAVIVDYKTDWCNNEEELREKYSRQLELYARVISIWLGVKIKECLIYSFKLEKAIRI